MPAIKVRVLKRRQEADTLVCIVRHQEGQDVIQNVIRADEVDAKVQLRAYIEALYAAESELAAAKTERGVAT